MIAPNVPHWPRDPMTVTGVFLRRFTNITPRVVTSDDPQLAPGSIETTLVTDAIHYVKDWVAYAKCDGSGGSHITSTLMSG
jgi:hypothetical protein